MRHTVIIICTALALIFAMGCEKKKDESIPPSPQVSPQPVTSEQVRKDVGEAFKTTKNYIMQEKGQYAQKAQEQLAELRKKVREMEPEVEKLRDDSKEEAIETIAQLQKKIRDLDNRVKSEKKSENGNWENTRKDIDSSLSQLRNTVGQKMGEISKSLQTQSPENAATPAQNSPTPANDVERRR